MTDLAHYVDVAKTSDYFSGARIADDLERFVGDQGDACRRLADESESVRRVFLVGSGGSYANWLSIKYLFDQLAPLPCEAVPSYELIWRDSSFVDAESLVILASFSGETEDTVAALRFAQAHGAKTVGIVRSANSTIGREADLVIPYESAACYEAPMVALCLYLARVSEGTPRAEEAAAMAASLAELPASLRRILAVEELRAESMAREFLHCTHMYVLGAGPLSALAYKVALSVLMENVRIGGTYCDACEFRHGPAEALERTKPDMMFLLGTDESRSMTLRTLDFCRKNGARILVYDAAEFGDCHPLLTPLVMNSVVQWFVVYSAILRGILDLDERVFMGRNVLAQDGAGWP
jgi:fructoselysine-6-P-deglycase FrlB-like protein